MPNMQVLCPYYVKDHMKAMLYWQMYVVLSLKFELIESILKHWLSIYFLHFSLLFRFKSKYGCPISSKITTLYFISNIIHLAWGLKIISNSVPLLNYPFKGVCHICKHSRPPWNFFCRWRLTLEEMKNTVKVLQLNFSLEIRNKNASYIFFKLT